ncbi:Protoporphyrinogen oxidase [Clostridium uliginosum]|uniref:Protoporphyrinogen oxidase n=2 Tax=Clostridium uliginosum TaxID=119641 RepID=A0A1I1JPH3_9CLOT|nr:Protoporphyrinogen oxidase [Clostridium uliginosum]
MNSINTNNNICVIGGGISGVFISHYLKENGYKNITLLEQSDRIGGKCNSIRYKGLTYEMGALMALPSYSNINELMDKFGVSKKCPLLTRGFYNAEGKKVQQLPKKQLYDFIKQFKKLSTTLKQYEFLKAPGYKNLPKELCMPFGQWCKNNDLTVVKKIYSHCFTTFGFGDIEEVATAYVLKLLNYENLMSFIEIPHIITCPEGIQELIYRISDTIDDVRLTQTVESVTPLENDKVIVKTNQEEYIFDKVICTISLKKFGELVSNYNEEKELFNKIIYEKFRVYAYKVNGIPKVCGYIPDNLKKDRNGHITIWYYRWLDTCNADIVTVYSYAKDGIDDREAKKIVEDDLRKLGGKNISLYMMSSWDHFPHVDAKTLSEGFYDKLEALQGKNNIYYSGEIMNFSNIESCVIYAKDLVDRFF